MCLLDLLTGKRCEILEKPLCQRDHDHRLGIFGDLTHIDDKEKIRSKMQVEYSDSSSHMNRVLACYDFSHTVKPGDFIFAKKGNSQLLGYGKVHSDGFFDDNRTEHKHVRKVNWVKKNVWDTSDHQVALKTLTDMTDYPDFVDYLKRVIGLIDPPPGPDRQRKRVANHFPQ